MGFSKWLLMNNVVSFLKERSSDFFIGRLHGPAVLGLYNVYVMNVPNRAFFVGDTLFRLALGLGFLYFYNRETKLAQAQAGAVLA